MNKYGRLPIWVAIEIWDFGMLSKLYAGMQFKHREQIAAKYGANNSKDFTGWLRGLNFIRNVSAHHSRLWNINVLERARVPQDDSYWQQLNNARPFLYFCLMQRLMRVICPNSRWSERFAVLLNEFPDAGSGTVTLVCRRAGWSRIYGAGNESRHVHRSIEVSGVLILIITTNIWVSRLMQAERPACDGLFS